jgi:hypothetical protein
MGGNKGRWRKKGVPIQEHYHNIVAQLKLENTQSKSVSPNHTTSGNYSLHTNQGSGPKGLGNANREECFRNWHL